MANSLATATSLLGSLAVEDVPFGARTTYRVGGNAALGAEANSVDDILAISRAVSDSEIDVFVLGKGSNLLVADEGFDGLVVTLGQGFGGCTHTGSIVAAGSGVQLPVLARKSVSFGLTGLEWAVGVPGSVGGAVRMNAGGHGSDMSATLIDVQTIRMGDSSVSIRSRESLELGYRESAIGEAEIVLSARFELSEGDKRTSEAELSEIVAWRRANQPGGQNSGSVFRNPDGDSAGRLIDAVGLKGLRVGSAEVSSKHANFIQAAPGGSATDIADLIALIQKRVFESAGVWLQPELVTVGLILQRCAELEGE